DSTNAEENIRLTSGLLESKGIDPESLILVHKPYMERRAYAAFMNFWPGKRLVVASPPIPFSDYPTEDLPKDLVINIMVGALQRIRIYPSRGFQIEQEIPEDVWRSYERLVELGYNRHLAS